MTTEKESATLADKNFHEEWVQTVWPELVGRFRGDKSEFANNAQIQSDWMYHTRYIPIQKARSSIIQYLRTKDGYFPTPAEFKTWYIQKQKDAQARVSGYRFDLGPQGMLIGMVRKATQDLRFGFIRVLNNQELISFWLPIPFHSLVLDSDPKSEFTDWFRGRRFILAGCGEKERKDWDLYPKDEQAPESWMDRIRSKDGWPEGLLNLYKAEGINDYTSIVGHVPLFDEEDNVATRIKSAPEHAGRSNGDLLDEWRESDKF